MPPIELRRRACGAATVYACAVLMLSAPAHVPLRYSTRSLRVASGSLASSISHQRALLA